MQSPSPAARARIWARAPLFYFCPRGRRGRRRRQRLRRGWGAPRAQTLWRRQHQLRSSATCSCSSYTSAYLSIRQHTVSIHVSIAKEAHSNSSMKAPATSSLAICKCCQRRAKWRLDTRTIPLSLIPAFPPLPPSAPLRRPRAPAPRAAARANSQRSHQPCGYQWGG
jgi:hypothetical protein